MYQVGAYKNGMFSHWASCKYYSSVAAEDYCERCRNICAPQTGMIYKVIEVEE